MESHKNLHLPKKQTKMNQGIAIPKPCHEDWNAMPPDTNGRHCGACSKTVVDFTDWTTDEIAAYLAARKYQSVCGRFKEEQLTQVEIEAETYVYELNRAGFSFLKKIAAVFLFVFCLSSGADAQQGPKVLSGAPKQVMMGKPARPTQGEIAPVKQRPDTLQEVTPPIMGLVAPQIKPPVKNPDHTIKGRVQTKRSRR